MSWLEGKKKSFLKMFSSKGDFLEAILKFIKSPSNSLAMTLAILTSLSMSVIAASNSTSFKVAMLIFLVMTWGEFFFSWKKRLDKA